MFSSFKRSGCKYISTSFYFYFFSHICTSDWNEQQDAGYSLQKATEEKLAAFPDPKWQQPIRDFYGRWIEIQPTSHFWIVDR